MKTNLPLRMLPILCATLVVMTHLARAVTNTWTAASGADLLWSTPGNWSPASAPGAGDDTRFFNRGATNDTVSISGIVSANTTIRSFWAGQTNGTHNLFINPGVTFTITGTNHNGYGPLGSDPDATAPDPNVQSTYYVGTKTPAGLTQTVTNTVSGGGTLVLSNANNELNVRQFWAGGGGAHLAVLDLSGLDTFVARLGRIRIGDGEAQPITRAEGQLLLAKTNTLTLTGTNLADNVQLVIGNNDVNNNGNGRINLLFLGQKNTLNVNQILVGGRKTQGDIRFNSVFTTPSLFLRGSDGVSRVAAFRIGDGSDQANSGNPCTGRVDFGPGTSDILADAIIVGKSQQQGGQSANGFLTVGAGTVDVNTLEVAYQFDNLAVNPVNGTVSFNNSAVTVNSLLRLGRSAGAAAARNATLNLNGGSVTVNGSYQNQGNVVINVTNSTLKLPAASSVSVNTLRLDGGVLTNVSTVRVTNSLLIVNSGSIPGNPVFDMGNSGAALWDVQGVAGGSLTVSNTLQGSGTIYGDLVQAPGGILIPGGNNAAGTNAVQIFSTGGNITFNGGTLRFDLTTNGLAGNDLITAFGNLTLNATNDVILTALGGVFDTVNPYTLMTAGTVVGNQTYFRIAGALAQSRYTFAFDTTSTPNSVKLSVGGTGPSSLTWVGDGAANLWDTQGAFNWSDGSSSRFFSLDAVTFDDSGSAAPPVNLTGTLIPGAITVNNPTKNYAFGGAGTLTASGLLKQGAGSLTISNSAANSFSSLVTVSNGAVTFANNGFNNLSGGLEVHGGSVTLAGGSTTVFAPSSALPIDLGASLSVANSNPNSFNGAAVQLEGSLTFNQAVDATMDGAIAGSGTLSKSGAGTLTLSGINNGLASVVLINGGTVKPGNSSALGIVGATIASGGAVDLNGQNLNALAITATGAGPSGNGAIVNFGAPVGGQNGVANLVLAGNTTIGGSGPWNTDPVLNFGRWDIRNGSLTAPNFKLTKTGLNQVSLANVSMDTTLADIDVQQGLLGLEGSTTSLGNTTNSLTVRAGATVSFFDTATAWDKKFILVGNGSTPNLMNYNGANTILGPVTLSNACVVSCVPANRGAPVSLTLGGSVGGPGSLIKAGQDTLILAGTGSYAGSTTVSNGTLNISGSLVSASGVIIAGGRLQGNGTITGNVTVQSGGTISAGESPGALTVTGTLTLQGTTLMEITRDGLTNDQLRVSTPLALGGALVVTNIGSPLLGGESFDLFNAPLISGSFASVQLPALASGLSWNTNQLGVNGIVSVIGTLVPPSISSATLSGTNLLVSGINGSAGGQYYVLSADDLTLPLASWTVVATNAFDASGNFSFTTPVDPFQPQRFYLIKLR